MSLTEQDHCDVSDCDSYDISEDVETYESSEETIDTVKESTDCGNPGDPGNFGIFAELKSIHVRDYGMRHSWSWIITFFCSSIIVAIVITYIMMKFDAWLIDTMHLLN